MHSRVFLQFLKRHHRSITVVSGTLLGAAVIITKCQASGGRVITIYKVYLVVRRGLRLLLIRLRLIRCNQIFKFRSVRAVVPVAQIAQAQAQASGWPRVSFPHLFAISKADFDRRCRMKRILYHQNLLRMQDFLMFEHKKGKIAEKMFPIWGQFSFFEDQSLPTISLDEVATRPFRRAIRPPRLENRPNHPGFARITPPEFDVLLVSLKRAFKLLLPIRLFLFSLVVILSLVLIVSFVQRKSYQESTKLN
jgi:hypothetical protein